MQKIKSVVISLKEVFFIKSAISGLKYRFDTLLQCICRTVMKARTSLRGAETSFLKIRGNDRIRGRGLFSGVFPLSRENKYFL